MSVKVKRGNKKLEYIVQSELTDYQSNYTSLNYSVKYVKKGIENYIIDGCPYELKQGQFLVVNPHQDIKIQINSKDKVVGCCFFMDPATVDLISTSKVISPSRNLSDIELKNENPQFSNFPINLSGTAFNYLTESPSVKNLLDKNDISDFLISIGESIVKHQQKVKSQTNKFPSIHRTTQLELFKRIQIGRQFIHDNISEDITLSQIASAAYLSEYHFHRSFRVFFGQTPFQYLQNIRLNKAKELFASGLYSLTEIVNSCGYNDNKYFRKVYRKYNLTNR